MDFRRLWSRQSQRNYSEGAGERSESDLRGSAH